MDRPLDESLKRKRLAKRFVLAGSGVSLVIVAFVALSAWMRPTLSLDRIRTGVVEHGPVEATISASGLVVPGFEHVISSPIHTQILAIKQQPGATLQAGMPIVELDVTTLTEALRDLEDQIAIQENSQHQTQLQRESEHIDLQSRLAIKKLDIESLEKTLADNRKLLAQNLLSEEDLRTSELNAEKARLEHRQLEAKLQNAEAATVAKLEELALEKARLHHDYNKQQRDLARAAVQATEAGVLTWVTPEVGATVRQGEVLARIADLSRFQVEATVSDVHAGRLQQGLSAHIRLGTTMLEGTVSRIRPTVENGTLTVDILLTDASHDQLRPNLRVDAFIVTDQRSETLRVARGPYLNGEGRQQVFVLRDGKAYRTAVTVGLLSFDYAEILDGLSSGDRIVTIDMTSFMHLDEVEVR